MIGGEVSSSALLTIQVAEPLSGAEPTRAGRDDRKHCLCFSKYIVADADDILGSDNSRRDRDNRDRPRSKVRDTSRTRRDTSTSRRDRDRDERDKGRDRRAEVERDDSRRDKDEPVRRDRLDWDDFYNRVHDRGSPTVILRTIRTVFGMLMTILGGGEMTGSGTNA